MTIREPLKGERERMEPTTTDILLDACKRAAAAHGVYEKELGRPDNHQASPRNNPL